jgi:Ca-activated chloride channel family protein
MNFGEPLWLLALPALPAALAGLWLWSGRRRARLLRAAFNTPLLDHLTRSVSPARRRGRQLLTALGVAALALALARPQWGRNQIEIERTGVDLVIALDVSRSMLAADAGNARRLAAATGALRRLLDALGGDRAALLLFAGEAYVAAPLTRDHTALARALDSAGPDAVSEQGSDLGKAIARARESFDRSAQGPRTLLVVSDGEQLQGNALEAARAAARDGVRVHTAGVGSAAGARLPRNAWERNSFVRNAAGREVISRRDEAGLQRIAAAGGGRYARIEGPDSAALVDWFLETTAPLARGPEKRLVDEPREQFQWPLAFALGLLGAAWLPGERRSTSARRALAAPNPASVP